MKLGKKAGFEPSWGLRHALAQLPNDKRADTDDHEHPAPADIRNDKALPVTVRRIIALENNSPS